MSPRVGAIIAVSVALASAAAIAIGQTTGPTGVVSVCTAADGTMRWLPSATDRCAAGETHLDFPATGPAGVRGPRGPQGDPGRSAAGPPGAAGADATPRPLPLPPPTYDGLDEARGPVSALRKVETLTYAANHGRIIRDDFSQGGHVLDLGCPNSGTAIGGWGPRRGVYSDLQNNNSWTAILVERSEPTAPTDLGFQGGQSPGGWHFFWRPRWVPPSSIGWFQLKVTFTVLCYAGGGAVEQSSATPAPAPATATGPSVPIYTTSGGTSGTPVAPTATVSPSGGFSTVLSGTPGERGSLTLLWSGENGSGDKAFAAAVKGGGAVIAKGAFRIGPSGRGRAHLHLDARGRRLVKTQGQLVTQLHVTARMPDGTTGTSTAILPIRRRGFRPPKPPKGTVEAGGEGIYTQRPQTLKWPGHGDGQ